MSSTEKLSSKYHTLGRNSLLIMQTKAREQIGYVNQLTLKAVTGQKHNSEKVSKAVDKLL